MKLAKITLLFILLSIFNFSFAAGSEFINVPNPKTPEQTQAVKLIKTYYTSLNAKDMGQFFSLMTSDVLHDIHNGMTEQGLTKFKTFMDQSVISFDEKIGRIVILISDNGKYAAARWEDQGMYVKDYPAFEVKAQNQKYIIHGVHFFEIRDGRISRVSTYYNDADFLAQVKR